MQYKNLCALRMCVREGVTEAAGMRVCECHAKLWRRKESFGRDLYPGESEAAVMRDIGSLVVVQKLCALEPERKHALIGVLTDHLTVRAIQRLLERGWIHVAQFDGSAVLKVTQDGADAVFAEGAKLRKRLESTKACREILVSTGKLSDQDAKTLDAVESEIDRSLRRTL